MEAERYKGMFEWEPPQNRSSRFGGKVYGMKPEYRKPFFYLGVANRQIYFVNSSPWILPLVRVELGGFVTYDDEVVAMKGSELVYKDVQPGEAVKIDEEDDYDEGVLGFQIHVETPIGPYSFNDARTNSSRYKEVLLWDEDIPEGSSEQSA